MKLIWENHSLTVIKEEKDPKFYGTKGNKGESRFLYHLQKALKIAGWDFIKKRMSSDGHLVDELKQYLRLRNLKKLNDGDIYCLYNNHWALSGLNDDFNEGKAVLYAEKVTLIPREIKVKHS